MATYLLKGYNFFCNFWYVFKCFFSDPMEWLIEFYAVSTIYQQFNGDFSTKLSTNHSLWRESLFVQICSPNGYSVNFQLITFKCFVSFGVQFDLLKVCLLIMFSSCECSSWASFCVIHIKGIYFVWNAISNRNNSTNHQ